MNFVPLPGDRCARASSSFYGGPAEERMVVGMRAAGRRLAERRAPKSRRRVRGIPATFLIAFVLMTLAAAVLTLWAVRRLTAPVRTLAAAAEALGRDVNAPPLPEDGPTEIATAAAAFNTMAGAHPPLRAATGPRC